MLILGTGAPAYVGPLDLVGGALVAYSQRALAAAWVSNAITIRRDSDDTTASFATTSSNAVNPAAITAFIGGGAGFSAVVFDQSGNASDLAQATLAAQPTWTATGAGAKPGIIATANGIDMFSAAFAFAGGAVYAAGVADLTTDTGPVLFALDVDEPSNPSCAIVGTWYNSQGDVSIVIANDGASNAQWATTAILADGLHLIEVWVDAAGAVTIYFDGVDADATLQFGTAVPVAAQPAMVVEYPDRANGGITDMELAVWNTIPSAPDRLAIRQNMMTYYGITMPTYAGPLDLAAGSIAAFSQRAMSAAKLGTALYTIRRDSDDTTQSFSSNASNGIAPVASIASFIGAAFNRTGATVDTVADVVMASVAGIAVGQRVSGAEITAGTVVLAINVLTVTLSLAATGTNPTATLTFVPLGYASVWTDQAGTVGNLAQATLVDQPTWKANAANQRSGFIDNASGVAMFTGPFAFAGGALYAAMVCNITIADGPVLFTLDTNAGGHPNVISLGTFYNVEGDLSLIVGASAAEWASTTALADGLHLIEMWIDGAGNVTMFADGADAGATLQAGALTAIAPEAAMVVEYPSRQSGGDVTQLEVAIWDTIPSAPNRLAIRQNMAAFYGITLA